MVRSLIKAKRFDKMIASRHCGCISFRTWLIKSIFLIKKSMLEAASGDGRGGERQTTFLVWTLLKDFFFVLFFFVRWLNVCCLCQWNTGASLQWWSRRTCIQIIYLKTPMLTALLKLKVPLNVYSDRMDFCIVLVCIWVYLLMVEIICGMLQWSCGTIQRSSINLVPWSTVLFVEFCIQNISAVHQFEDGGGGLQADILVLTCCYLNLSSIAIDKVC